MFHLLPIPQIFGVVSVLSIALFLAVEYLFPSNSLQNIVKLFGIVSFVTLLVCSIFWRYIWSFKILNRYIFPKIRGVWEGKVTFSMGEGLESRVVVAQIQQTLGNINVRLESEESVSETQIASAHRDRHSEKKTLYYVYHNVPRANKHTATQHFGAAHLEVYLEPKLRLKGNYFNDQGRKGQLELTLMCDDPDTFDNIRHGKGW